MIDLEGNGTPEVHLWRAVITQAIGDATLILHPPKMTEGKEKAFYFLEKAMKENIRERDKARDWLLGNSRNFRTACEMAMLDPDAVREAAEELQRQEWPSQKAARAQRAA